jgi:hypothetical protein
MRLKDLIEKYDNGELKQIETADGVYCVKDVKTQVLIIETLRRYNFSNIPSKEYLGFSVHLTFQDVIYKGENALSQKYILKENNISLAKDVVIELLEFERGGSESL